MEKVKSKKIKIKKVINRDLLIKELGKMGDEYLKLGEFIKFLENKKEELRDQIKETLELLRVKEIEINNLKISLKKCKREHLNKNRAKRLLPKKMFNELLTVCIYEMLDIRRIK